MQGLEMRLAILERSNRRMRFTAIAAALILPAGVLLGLQGAGPRTIEAEQIILRDAKGVTRGVMRVNGDGPALDFYDSNKPLRLVLSVVKDIQNLPLKTPNGTGTAVLADAPTGP